MAGYTFRVTLRTVLREARSGEQRRRPTRVSEGDEGMREVKALLGEWGRGRQCRGRHLLPLWTNTPVTASLPLSLSHTHSLPHTLFSPLCIWRYTILPFLSCRPSPPPWTLPLPHCPPSSHTLPFHTPTTFHTLTFPLQPSQLPSSLSLLPAPAHCTSGCLADAAQTTP